MVIIIYTILDFQMSRKKTSPGRSIAASGTKCFIREELTTTIAFVSNRNKARFTTSHSSFVLNGEISSTMVNSVHRSMWISDDKNNTSSPGRSW